MPFDVFTLHHLTRELSALLCGGKIVKITQPEADEIALFIHSVGENFKLTISCSPNLPRINFSRLKSQNPIVAPSFCMSLRKHISAGIITGISLFNNDRIVDINISAYGEMLDKTEYHLLAELMGRYSNIILADENYKITSCCKQIAFGECNRQILSGMHYEPPNTNGKISILDDKISDLKNFNFADIKSYANEKLMGFSTQTLNEIVYRSELDGQGKTNGEKFLNTLNFLLKAESAAPCFNDKDFFVFPYKSLPSNYVFSDDLSTAIESSLNSREKTLRMKERTKHLSSAVKNALSRTEKKIAAQEQKLLDCSKTELYKTYGDLLLINLYRKTSNIEGITVPNIYDNNSPIEIPLDNTKNLKQNSQEYYRKYAKLKRTRENVTSMLTENKTLAGYLKNLQREIADAETEAEIDDIKAEIAALGLHPAKSRMAVKQKTQSTPHKYYFNDTTILVGKNNIQNDKLTFGTAKKSDYWFHIKNYHGSHVIVMSSSPDVNTIKFAAELAAYFSEIKDNAKVIVDYTAIRNVKKNGALGLVTYTDYSSVTVMPNQHKEFLADL